MAGVVEYDGVAEGDPGVASQMLTEAVDDAVMGRVFVEKEVNICRRDVQLRFQELAERLGIVHCAGEVSE